jgi:hypothetical protein
MSSILLRSGFLLGITVLFSACGGSDDGTNGSTGGSSDCGKVCTAILPLKCPKEPTTADACEAKCQQVINAVPMCKTQMEALMKCSATHPTADWECDKDEGDANLKTGCDAESLAAFGCILGGGA